MKQHILFVCLGNICRSVAAQGIFESILEREGAEDRFFVDSAGTYSGHAGELADPRMRRAASARGVELTHRSRAVCYDDFDRFDYIIAMDDSNFDNLQRLAPTHEATRKISRMADFIDLAEVDHVPDPYYQGHQGFEYVLDLLERGCVRLYDQVGKPTKD
ncbi:MAG: low molecular weight protein-tyrosine-phosphatase [Rikenellaceae bacterium]